MPHDHPTYQESTLKFPLKLELLTNFSINLSHVWGQIDVKAHVGCTVLNVELAESRPWLGEVNLVHLKSENAYLSV